MRAKPGIALALLASLGAVACQAAPEPPGPARQAERPRLGVMTTLPLIWGEAEDIGELLRAQAGAQWVREELERRFVLAPLDVLESAPLARLDNLVLAQPRALSPAENVVLDRWVRAGGKLLVFADPMLTRHSRYEVGDRRRPQDVVLLSPILSHWGLELQFDEDQAASETTVDVEGASVPIDLAGTFRLRSQAGCTVAAGGVLARCRLGAGEVVVLADAAVLDDPGSGDLAQRRAALARLLALAFG